MMLRLTDALRQAATRCVWFETPEQAILHPARFAAYVFTYGAPSDVDALRAQLADSELVALLDAAPPGIFDPRSWAYWNLMMGRSETPPMPQRSL